jgi:hypothetical protein
MCLGAAVAAAAFGGLLDFPRDGILGVHSVEAKDYYTRKRVNGRWITGHFPKRSMTAKATPKRLAARFASTASPSPDYPRRSRLAAAPRARPVFAPEPASPEPAASAPPASTPEPLAPPPNDERMMRLRAALQAHAKTLATGSLRPVAGQRQPEPAAPNASTAPDASAGPNASSRPQPAAIAFDLQTGLKRTTFTDGSVLEEEFDVEAVKGRMGSPPKEPRGPGGAP